MTTTLESPGPEASDTPAAPAAPTTRLNATGAAGRRRRHLVLLLLPLIVAFGVRLAFALTDDAPSTDESAYLRSGLSIWAGDGFRRENLPELHFPPGLPFALGGLAELTDDPHTAAVGLTLVTGTLLVLPLAGVTRRVGGDRAGLATAWVVALCPGLTGLIVNRGAGSEAPYTLLVVTAMYLVVIAPRAGPRGQVAATVGAGAAIGAAYLTRPEGLFLGGVLAAGVLLGAGAWRRGLALVAVFALPIALMAAPYVSYLHDKTGKLQLTAKTQDASIEAWRSVAEGDRRSRDAVLYELDDTGFGFAPGRTSLVGLAREDPTGYLGIVAVNVGSLFDDVFVPEPEPIPGWGLLPLPLVLVGAWGAWRYRRSRIMWLVLGTAAVPILTALAFFVQPRYLIPPLAILCVPVGLGLAAIGTRGRASMWGGAGVLLVLSVVPQLHGDGSGWFRPTEHVEHRVVGEWLAEHTDPGTRIMTRSMVTEFYAERRAVAMPYASIQPVLRFAQHYGVEYLVADEYHLRSYRPQLAVLFEDGNLPGLRLVKEWEIEGRITRVFALDPAPEPGRDDGPPLGFVGDGT